MGDQPFLAILAFGIALLVPGVLSKRLNVPGPILLVPFGAVVGFLPALHGLHVQPEVVLNVFLPPLIYRAAFLTAPRESRQDALPITILAVGLTSATALCVMVAVGFAVPGLPWAAALALGAAIAPTDPVAATSVLQRVGAPRRLVTILEGESLLNDGVALTLFGLALSGLSGEVTVADGVIELLRVVCGGILYGLAVAWVIGKVRRVFHDAGSQIVLSLLTPFVAYLPAEHFGVSGVLATIVTGFVLGISPQGVLQPASRLSGQVFWRVLSHLLESTLFVLLGVQIMDVFHEVRDLPWTQLALTALVAMAVVIVLRLAWTALVLAPVRLGRPIERRQRLVLGWAGMRGAITLAIALSIPLDAPNRALLIFLAACVVLVTLGVQATTLAPVLRRLGVGEPQEEVQEDATAREALLEAALARLDELAADDKVDDRTAEVFRQLFELRLDRVREVLGDLDGDGDGADADAGAESHHVGLRRELIRAQRDKLRHLYRKGVIGADTMRKLDHELDVEERRRVSGGA
ncbi:Na+/H+ antiporter [Nonomuraea sp. 3-1Str]|uniref:Na+/H+ antiporter n=1 Tax=Nonomuraea sp. 3-1Str TaxID=2929801 RepID=UPI002856CC03|nr:Na+/H+ antiporter [Nonomuraea sp. 3-1Str]MDR8412181.1 Na+/H+ antiporter [Nonomuraea sp. 3-1Str]